VHYLDQALGEFVNGLRDAKLLDRTLLVLYGDHKAFLEKPPELAALLGLSKFDRAHWNIVRKKIPLLIRLPGNTTGKVISTAGGQIDTAPTILRLLGIKSENEIMLGWSLLNRADHRVVFRDGSFVNEKHFCAKFDGPLFKPSCYDLETWKKTDVTSMESYERAALEELEISDIVLFGDLIPALFNSIRR
jgi:phosphoglycerol transferase MdoB-like AlkP superfamily enzyme